METMWQKTINSCNGDFRQLHEIYSMHRFPIEARHYLADWLETQAWSDLDETNPANEQIAIGYLEQTISLLEEKAAEIDSGENFLTKMKLQQTAIQFRSVHGSNPLGFISLVKNCLAAEERLLQQAQKQQLTGDTAASGQSNVPSEGHVKMNNQIEFLRRATQETDGELRSLQHKQESFIIQYQDNMKVNAQIQQWSNSKCEVQVKKENEARLQKQKQGVELQLRSKAQDILQMRLALSEKHKNTVDALAQLQRHVLEKELVDWRRRQQLSGNGAEFDNNLDVIQLWCEQLAELIWANRQQIMRTSFMITQLPMDLPSGCVDLQPYLQTTITSLLSSLVTSTFIIEKQPPQVLKKESRFMATVRLLVGGKLNIHMNPPQVKATIISEAQARQLLKNEKGPNCENSGEILNNIGQMEYHQATGQLSVTFRNMQLKRIKRADRKGSEAVTEEKFSILFSSSFKSGDELVFTVWTLSLPVVVTVHGNQECNAMATVLWDNAFAEPGRIPFVVPEKVSWIILAEALNCKYKHHTGRGLSEENLKYLAQKFYGTLDNDYSQHMVHWSQFNKEPLPGRNFTFWEWFHGVLKLTKEYLKGPWNDGSILGFVSKIQAQEMLSVMPYGTFLLRFSDSEVGGVTIAWVGEDPAKPVVGDPQVWNLTPYTAKDFSMRGLADRVRDLPLATLYPNISKEIAFEKYFSPPEETKSRAKEGYIGSCLRDTLPSGMMPGAALMSYDNPNTPQAMNPNSPAQASTTDSHAVTGIEDEIDLDSYLMDYGADDISQININAFLTMDGSKT